MSRFLTNLKFWAVAFSLTWIAVVVFVIADHPEFARAAH
ncbi:hypothetical protein FHX82_004318 [Amycolatopsis bartoniae]|nr:hypothetical protein [Amycolatopsis bartoniae]